jgi:hypothetical protein
MTSRAEPPLARLTAVFAIVLAMAACSETTTAPTPEPVPAPAPAPSPGPAPAPAPAPDPLDELTTAAFDTRRALSAAAETGDWDAVAALIPEDTLFTSNFGGETDHIAFYRSSERDLIAEMAALLDGPFAQLDDIFIWPDLHARVPFTVADGEREELEERYGAESLAQWEGAGSYLGWRIGITADGEWIFFVAGD